jgi:hypothetical protein
VPIFSRRRLASMLEAIDVDLDKSKRRDLINRLESKRVDQAIPAEIELGMLWALRMLGPIEVESVRLGTRSRPDAHTEFLFPGHQCIVEITAVSDARLAQEDDMRRTASRICEAANKIRKGSGRHLHFDFGEQVSHHDRHQPRSRRVDPNFRMSASLEQALRSWLLGDRKIHLLMEEGRTGLAITWQEHKVPPLFNFFSTMPAETYSLTENPLYEALSEKATQLRGDAFQGLRCLLLGDAGSRLLHDLQPSQKSMGTYSGAQIIQAFLSQPSCGLDVICIFSPQKPFRFMAVEQARFWSVKVAAKPGLQLPLEGIQQISSMLPAPRFTGSQARQLHQQGMYEASARGWYLGSKLTNHKKSMTFRISSRALLELLAEKISTEQFLQSSGLAGGNRPNLLAHRLAQGDIISSAAFEHGGVDEDDDYVVIELSPDPSAMTLKAHFDALDEQPEVPDLGTHQ